MLSQKARNSIKTVFKIDPDQLISAVIAADEVDMKIPTDLKVFKLEDLETRDRHVKAAGRLEGEGLGELNAAAHVVKRIAKKLQLDEDNIGADIDKLEAGARARVSAGDAGLQQQINSLTGEVAHLSENVIQERNKADQTIFDCSLVGMFPADRTGDLKDQERLLLLKNDLQFENIDGATIVSRGGTVIIDPATKGPLPLDRVINEIFTERKWTASSERVLAFGRGGGNSAIGSGSSSIKKLSEFTEKWIAENPGENSVSVKFDTALSEHLKNCNDFDFNA